MGSHLKLTIQRPSKKRKNFFFFFFFSLSLSLPSKIVSRRALVVSSTDLQNTITIIIRHLLLACFSCQSHQLDCILFLSSLPLSLSLIEKILTSVFTSRHQKPDETERFIIRHHHRSCLLSFSGYTSGAHARMGQRKSVCSPNCLSCSQSFARLDTQLFQHSL